MILKRLRERKEGLMSNATKVKIKNESRISVGNTRWP